VGGGSTDPFNGLIDEFRIIKGVAVYTANFTPPTAPFTNLPMQRGPNFFYGFQVTATLDDRQVNSNFVALHLPLLGFSITAASGLLGGQNSEGYANAAYPAGPTGALNPTNAMLAGFPVAAFFVNTNNSGDEGFYIALDGAPLNAVWHISFTDSNSVVWDLLSTNMQHFQQGQFAVWDITMRGATPYPLLLAGITYPITVLS
jgi:hypothetical protein